MSPRAPAAHTPRPARVLLLALDGFPHQAISAERTPTLAALGRDGGHAPGGGLASLPATTYPGFATLLTGCLPERHGVRTTSHRAGAVPGWAGRRRVAVPTLADAVAATGLGVVAVLGDHKLHRVLRLGGLTRWPVAGRVPPGVALDAHGYPANASVRGPLLRTAAEPGWSLMFAHLNEVDTLGHELGPDHPDTIAAHRATDALVGELLEVLGPEWERTLVVVVSDHGMEADGRRPGITIPVDEPELAPLVEDWIPDGGAAWVRLRRGADPAAAGERLAAMDGVAGWSPAGPTPAARRRLLLVAHRGRAFWRPPRGGIHGGPATAGTVALAGGAHPSAAIIAAAIRERPPHLADWAPTIAEVLGVRFGGVDGRSLLG